MSSRYPILQSGFVGVDEKFFVFPEIVKNPFVDLTLNKDHLKVNNPYWYHKRVSQMYNELRGDASKIRDMAFREEILKAAYECFGNNLVTFMRAQAYSDMLSYQHVAFMEETMKIYMMPPEPHRAMSSDNNTIKRTISLPTYLSVIRASKYTVPKKLTFHVNPHGAREGMYIESSVDKMLINITGRKNGFEDLLWVLNIIFGARPEIVDVAEKNVY